MSLQPLHAALGFVAYASLGATLIGVLAPIWPAAELGNILRPFILLGSLGLLAITLWQRVRRPVLPALTASIANLALMAGTLALVPSPAGPDGGTASLTPISANIWARNSRSEDMAEFLRRERADVVVLQEVRPALERAVFPALSDIYPHQVSCGHVRRCGLAILSRHAFAEAGYTPAGGSAPPLVHAARPALSAPFG